jgi:hypothetical protein
MWAIEIFVSEVEYPLQIGSSTDILYELALEFSVASTCDYE